MDVSRTADIVQMVDRLLHRKAHPSFIVARDDKKKQSSIVIVTLRDSVVVLYSPRGEAGPTDLVRRLRNKSSIRRVVRLRGPAAASRPPGDDTADTMALRFMQRHATHATLDDFDPSSSDRCLSQDPNISRYLQEFIYCLNDERHRDTVIRRAIKSDMQWLGTWYVRNLHDQHPRKPPALVIASKSRFCPTVGAPLADVIRANISVFAVKDDDTIYRYKCFTVCILYQTNLVHYVAFVFDVRHRSLLSFDPGVELYQRGLKTVIPALRKIFFTLGLCTAPMLKQDALTVGRCDMKFHGKRFGVQYNGRIHRDLPADAFCQTWTLFFLVRLHASRDASFVQKEWCKIDPFQREAYLLVTFIIPLLTSESTVSRAYFAALGDPKHEVLRRLMAFTTRCLFRRIKLDNPASASISKVIE